MTLNHHPEKQTTGRAVRRVRFLRENKAVSALEYAILVGVIAVGIGIALTAFSGQIKTALKNSGDQIVKIAGLK